MSDKKSHTKFNRRNFLKIAGATGLVAGAGAMLPKDVMLARAEKGDKGKMSFDVKPGKLDDDEFAVLTPIGIGWHDTGEG